MTGALVGAAVGGWAAFGSLYAGGAVAGLIGQQGTLVGAIVAGDVNGAINGAAMGFAAGTPEAWAPSTKCGPRCGREPWSASSRARPSADWPTRSVPPRSPCPGPCGMPTGLRLRSHLPTVTRRGSPPGPADDSAPRGHRARGGRSGRHGPAGKGAGAAGSWVGKVLLTTPATHRRPGPRRRRRRRRWDLGYVPWILEKIGVVNVGPDGLACCSASGAESLDLPLAGVRCSTTYEFSSDGLLRQFREHLWNGPQIEVQQLPRPGLITLVQQLDQLPVFCVDHRHAVGSGRVAMTATRCWRERKVS